MNNRNKGCSFAPGFYQPMPSPKTNDENVDPTNRPNKRVNTLAHSNAPKSNKVAIQVANSSRKPESARPKSDAQSNIHPARISTTIKCNTAVKKGTNVNGTQGSQQVPVFRYSDKKLVPMSKSNQRLSVGRGSFGVKVLYDENEGATVTPALVISNSELGKSILEQYNGRYCNVGYNSRWSGNYSKLVMQFTPYYLCLTEDDYDRMIKLIVDDDSFETIKEDHIKKSQSFG
eukprot:scaffold52669_cov40-Cyclotella_meneghiniana.AAC.6